MPEVAGSLLAHFSDLDDPRRYNRWHPLFDIIVIAICGVLCGADDWPAVEELVLSLNFRDERSVSGLDVVTVAKDYQDVVSEDLIWQELLTKITFSACKFSTSSMPYSDRYNMQVF